ncbi:hypothetical protein [Streptomyces virginiae]|uniref:Uncharacterized protein n=1 Tax=Streptomyces virginiae TaxID=1961 RepID=A0ABZ1TQE4_STRVG|nr:hypothetical protein [Streptomyces virginiae]
MANAAQELASLGDNYTPHSFPGQDHKIDPCALAPVLTSFFTTGRPV